MAIRFSEVETANGTAKPSGRERVESGKRQRAGSGLRTGGKSAKVDAMAQASRAGLGRDQEPGALSEQLPGAGPADVASRRPFDRVAYQRELMRKRRAAAKKPAG